MKLRFTSKPLSPALLNQFDACEDFIALSLDETRILGSDHNEDKLESRMESLNQFYQIFSKDQLLARHHDETISSGFIP